MLGRVVTPNRAYFSHVTDGSMAWAFEMPAQSKPGIAYGIEESMMLQGCQ
jgi:hypothetical protein